VSRALPNPRRKRRGRRRGGRRRRNPWTRGQKIGAAIGAVALVATPVVIYVLANRWAKGMASAFDIGPETINFNYVPHLETWPHMDRFSNEYAFGVALQSMGYDPGSMHTNETWTIIDARPIESVREFQRDYNLVRQIQLPDPVPTPPLVEDGLIGNNTAIAFWDAEQWMTAMNLTWPELIELAWEELGIG